MNELSIFIDESGNLSKECSYYLVTLVFHEQATSIEPLLLSHFATLSESGLPTIPFHLAPIMHGSEPFDVYELQTRKRLIARFDSFARRLPFTYTTISCRTKEVGHDETALSDRLERQIESFIREHLAYFQSFGKVKIYYDKGQAAVSQAIHHAIETALSKEAIVYRYVIPRDYILLQVADYVCGIELCSIKYARKQNGRTESLFFGDKGNFAKNYLKKIRRKRLD